MTTLREAAQQALETLDRVQPQIRGAMPQQDVADAITTLRAALAEPMKEPVGWLENPYGSFQRNFHFYLTLPPQTLEWQIPLYLHEEPR